MVTNSSRGTARRLSRRRAISIVAASGAGLLAGLATGPARARPRTVTWRGTALGADASIVLAHEDPEAGRRLIHECAASIERYESVFSLYRPDSALSRLNRDGALAAPPPDLVQVLRACRRFHALTQGAFDPTVQPLWCVYERAFSRRVPGPPQRAELDRVRALVGMDAVSVTEDLVAFARPGMAMTLNGIAQGYVTDRIADHLRRNGIRRVLADLGETRALGDHPDGRPWRVGIADPRRRGEIFRSLPLVDRAIATSSGLGTPFDAQALHHHLFDPRTGECPNHYLSVSVVARTATEADALSTGLFVLPVAAAEETLGRTGDAGAIAMLADGSVRTLGRII